MSISIERLPMSADSFYAVTAEILRQTIEESKIEYSIDMGDFIVHHGTRDRSPIVIAEHKNQKDDQLSGVWFDSNGEFRK